jgi:diguanylate cyclase (GGDEF)-like protein
MSAATAWLRGRFTRRSYDATPNVAPSARGHFEIAFHRSSSGLALLDADGRVVQANPALLELCAVDASKSVDGRAFAELLPGDVRAKVAAALTDAHGTGSPGCRVELHLLHGKAERWLVVAVTPLHFDGVAFPIAARSLVQVDDITDQRRMERHLAAQSARDPLTSLGNRVLLFESLDYATKTGAALRSTVLFLDLDRFKWVNDTLGHDAGDVVLIEVANRLRTLVRPGDLVTRVGGDEFVVVLRELFSAEEAVDVAERVVLALREPIKLAAHNVTVLGSVGVSLPGSANEDGQSRVADADSAMYRAKQAGGNRAEVFTPPMRIARERALEMDSALRQALATGALDLWYQPIVNLRTGGFEGVEALLRWPGRDTEVEAAISVAEKTDLIVALGEWVITRALRDNPGGLLEVNVSVRELIRPKFTDGVIRALQAADVDPTRLCIEVTETSIAENVDAVVDALHELRATGIRVAIDDFGTGHASLTYLAKFPVDIVKVDKSFVRGLGNDPASGVIVRSVAAMAHALGMTVIAEGVESLNQLEMVLEAGCDAAQGYLFSRPVPRQKCVETLANAVPWPVGFSGQRASAPSRQSAPTVEPARRYRMLLDLARDITGRLDLDEVLAASFVALRQLLPFGGGSIQLLDESGAVVRLAAADPPATPEAYETLIPVGQGIGGRIVSSGEPRYIPDILLDPDVPAWRATSDGVRSYFGVPLITEGASIGVLQIDSPDVDPWSEEDRFTVLAFTPIVAAAIQNARLFEREAAAAMLPRPRPGSHDEVAALDEMFREGTT